MKPYQSEFLQLCIERNVLRFGSYTLKSGRQSPYFFNAGLFDSGDALSQLGSLYAQSIINAGLQFDVLFGPAYKGIPLAAAIAVAFSRNHGRDVPFCYNRKEVKDHGEGGHLVGAPLKGRILVVDDVVSAGTSVAESVQIIQHAGASLAGVSIALDRQERGVNELSATQEIQSKYGVPTVSIANLETLISYLRSNEELSRHRQAVLDYRDQWGAALD